MDIDEFEEDSMDFGDWYDGLLEKLEKEPEGDKSIYVVADGKRTLLGQRLTKNAAFLIMPLLLGHLAAGVTIEIADETGKTVAELLP